MNFIETCNCDNKNHMLNIWHQIQIIDLSTYVTGYLPFTPGFVIRRIFTFVHNFILCFDLIYHVSPILLPT